MFNDSVAGMFCRIKNLLTPRETRLVILNVIKRDDQWFIDPSSEFFQLVNGDNDKTDIGSVR